jgi:DNA-directed RNA polymerase subunit RPC12/RpoP
MKDYKCPVCDADITLDGDEGPGDAVYCSYCNSTIKIYRSRGSDDLKLVDDN